MSKSTVIRLLAALFELISAEMIRTAIVGACDALTRSIEGTENKVDDAVLPLIRKIRALVAE